MCAPRNDTRFNISRHFHFLLLWVKDNVTTNTEIGRHWVALVWRARIYSKRIKSSHNGWMKWATSTEWATTQQQRCEMMMMMMRSSSSSSSKRRRTLRVNKSTFTHSSQQTSVFCAVPKKRLLLQQQLKLKLQWSLSFFYCCPSQPAYTLHFILHWLLCSILLLFRSFARWLAVTLK